MNPDSNYKNLYTYYTSKLQDFLNISSFLTSNTPINHFTYQRLYIGGKHLILFTNQEYAKYFFETIHDLGEHFGERIKKSKPNDMLCHFWPTTPDTPYFQGMFNYKIWNGITISIKRNDYVDVYYFATNHEINNAIEMHNFYINKINFIGEFINFFNSQAYEVINTKDPQILGQHTGPIILDKFEPSEEGIVINKPEIKRFYIHSLERKTYLTHQELECLKNLSKGYSIKFASQKLGISPKTMQHYLQSIKLKTGLNAQDLLLEWFHAEFNKFGNT